jgi:hypothetical protein
VRPVLELAPGRANDGPASGGQPLIAPPVVFEGLTGSVRPSPVGLDNDPVRRPGEVGADGRPAIAWVDVKLGYRIRESKAARESEQRLLEVVLGRGAPDVVLG